jgi:hypothetical protein
MVPFVGVRGARRTHTYLSTYVIYIPTLETHHWDSNVSFLEPGATVR